MTKLYEEVIINKKKCTYNHFIKKVLVIGEQITTSLTDS